SEIKRCVYDVLINGASAEEVTLATPYARLSLIPATIQLAGAEIELVSALSRETKLKRALNPLAKAYDYIFLDCPPSLGLLTVNALAAADSLIIPIQSEYYALEGLSQLMNTFDLVKKHLNPDLRIEGVLLTMFDPRTNLAVQVAEEVRGYFGANVYEAVISRNVRLSESPSHGKPIFYYDARSKGAEQYQQLAGEFLSRQK
ncbi:MAG: ParA family protein, partial [Clostridiales bacterium]|nr:ParA family protein [Clostridiales bacterium]